MGSTFAGRQVFFSSAFSANGLACWLVGLGPGGRLDSWKGLATQPWGQKTPIRGTQTTGNVPNQQLTIDILGSWTQFSQKHQLANPKDLALKNTLVQFKGAYFFQVSGRFR